MLCRAQSWRHYRCECISCDRNCQRLPRRGATGQPPPASVPVHSSALPTPACTPARRAPSPETRPTSERLSSRRVPTYRSLPPRQVGLWLAVLRSSSRISIASHPHKERLFYFSLEALDFHLVQFLAVIQRKVSEFAVFCARAQKCKLHYFLYRLPQYQAIYPPRSA